MRVRVRRWRVGDRSGGVLVVQDCFTRGAVLSWMRFGCECVENEMLNVSKNDTECRRGTRKYLPGVVELCASAPTFDKEPREQNIRYRPSASLASQVSAGARPLEPGSVIAAGGTAGVAAAVDMQPDRPTLSYHALAVVQSDGSTKMPCQVSMR